MMCGNGLAKLLEECGELSQVAAKKLAYPNTDNHPDDGGSLKTRLENEIADVAGASLFVIAQYGLDQEAINRRAALKLATFKFWHSNPEN